MKLLDCTLRDGANVVGTGFSAEITEKVIHALISCHICDIEFGNAKGMGANEKNGIPAPLSDLEYLRLANSYTKQARLGMFLQPKYEQEESIRMAAEQGVYFIRVGVDAGDGKKAAATVKRVRKAGLFCRFSLMKAYISSPSELAKEAKMLEEEGVEAITIMDSAGMMFPEDVVAYVTALKEKVTIPVGFHGHNNMGFSQANALAAAQAGADEVDCGLLGMARSAGNCATELVTVAFLRKKIIDDIDLYKLLDFLDIDLIPLMAKHDYHVAIKPIDLVLGISGCHSSFLSDFQNISDEMRTALYELIIKVSAVDKKNPSRELIRRIAAQMKDFM